MSKNPWIDSVIGPNIKISFVKTHEDAQLPQRNNKEYQVGDTGYDIYAVEDVEISPHSTITVPIGLDIAFIERGYWIRIESRSGMFFRHGITAFNGVVDNCVPKGTKIYTKNGQINVEDLLDIEDNHIYSFNEESREIENDKIKDIWVVPNLNLTEIVMDDNTSIKIPEHKKVLTKRGWIDVKDLNESDEIYSLT
jgi:dUTPase